MMTELVSSMVQRNDVITFVNLKRKKKHNWIKKLSFFKVGGGLKLENVISRLI